jgi:hypothetical protein
MGVDAEATHDSTFVWSDGTAIGSTTNNEFSVYASNGIRLLGGTITGNGSGLTNVNALTIGGVALAGLVQTNAALDRLRLNDGGGLTNLNLVGSGGITNITGGGTWTLSGGSYTFTPATDASRAATGTVITVTANGNSGSVTVGTGGTIALGSDAGKVTTNATFSQLGVRDGSGLTNIPLAALQTVPLTNNHTAAVTLGGNVTLNGTANLAPNQTAASGASVMTRDLGDGRYLLGVGSVGSNNFYFPNAGFSGSSGWVYGTNYVFKTELQGGNGVRLGYLANADGCSIVGATMTASSRPLLIGLTTEGYSRFGVYADGKLGWGTGTHTMDGLLSLSSRSNLLASGTWTFNAAAGNGSGLSNVINAVKVQSSTVTTNFLTLDASGVPIYVSGTTTQKVTLGSYP